MRIVLLGASNLVREPWLAIETARRVLGAAELDVFGAFGHGRSYGMRTRFAARSLPGILDCGLWKALAEQPPDPLYALVTDIGNDIGYEAGAEQTAVWVEECLRRLAAHRARIVITGVPIVSLERFADWQIGLTRRLFFPTSSLTPADVWREVRELDRRLREIGERPGVEWVGPEADWYGFDPIHFRRRRAAAAFGRMMSSWSTSAAAGTPARRSFWNWLRIRVMLPESWKWLGRELGCRQPAGVLPGAVRVFLY